MKIDKEESKRTGITVLRDSSRKVEPVKNEKSKKKSERTEIFSRDDNVSFREEE